MQFTQWESMSRGVSNSKIKLMKKGANSLGVESSGKYKFIIFPSIILILVVSALIATGSALEFGLKNYVGLAFFIGITGAVIYFVHKLSFKQSTFDFNTMTYHDGSQQKLNLNDVKGIQILTHHHMVQGNYRIRFEINLVKSNGERLHLFNNSKYQLIQKQAAILSNKLNVEVWDATSA